MLRPRNTAVESDGCISKCINGTNNLRINIRLVAQVLCRATVWFSGFVGEPLSTVLEFRGEIIGLGGQTKLRMQLSCTYHLLNSALIEDKSTCAPSTNF